MGLMIYKTREYPKPHCGTLHKLEGELMLNKA